MSGEGYLDLAATSIIYLGKFDNNSVNNNGYYTASIVDGANHPLVHQVEQQPSHNFGKLATTYFHSYSFVPGGAVPLATTPLLNHQQQQQQQPQFPPALVGAHHQHHHHQLAALTAGPPSAAHQFHQQQQHQQTCGTLACSCACTAAASIVSAAATTQLYHQHHRVLLQQQQSIDVKDGIMVSRFHSFLSRYFYFLYVNKNSVGLFAYEYDCY